MAGNFRINGLLSMAVDGLFNVQRMGAALSQVANAGDNVAKAFQAQAYAAGFANMAVTRFAGSLAQISGVASEFEDSMAKAASLVGPTSTALDRIRTTAMLMRDVAQGPAELVNGLVELHRAGIEGAQAINDIKVVADVATIAEMKMAEAAVSVATAFKGWAGPLDTSAGIMDRFVAAANQSTFGLKSLMKAMEMAQRQAIPMGVSLESTLTGLMLLAPITGPNSKAGTTFGSFADRMGDPRVLKQLNEKFPNLKLSPYSKNGVRKDPLDYMADIMDKRMGMGNADQKKDALDKILTGKIGRGMFAAFQRLYDQGIEITDPLTGAKHIKVGREGLQAARDSLTGKNMSLADQAKTVRDMSPKAAWQMFQADIERGAIQLGKTLIEIFYDIKPALTSMAKAFQQIVSIGDGAVVKLFGVVAAIGMLRIAAMGFMSVMKIFPAYLTGNIVGPLNPGSTSYHPLNNPGAPKPTTFGGWKSAMMSGLGGPGWMSGIHSMAYNNAMNKVQSMPMNARFVAAAKTGDAAAIETLHNRAVQGYTGAAGTITGGTGGFAGTMSKFVDKYYGMAGMGRAYQGGYGAFSSAGKSAGLGLGGKLITNIGGAVAGGGAALGALGVTALAAVGPLAALAAVTAGLTYWMEKRQEQEEAQTKNKQKAMGIIEDLPTVHRMAMKLAGGGDLGEAEMQTLVQNPTLVPILSRLIEAGAATQAAGTGTAGFGVTSGYMNLLKTFSSALGGDKAGFRYEDASDVFGDNPLKAQQLVAKVSGQLVMALNNNRYDLTSNADLGRRVAKLGEENPVTKFGGRFTRIGPKDAADADKMNWLNEVGGGLPGSGKSFGTGQGSFKSFLDLAQADNPVMRNANPIDTVTLMKDLGLIKPGTTAATQQFAESFQKLDEYFKSLNNGATLQEAAAALRTGADILIVGAAQIAGGPRQG